MSGSKPAGSFSQGSHVMSQGAPAGRGACPGCRGPRGPCAWRHPRQNTTRFNKETSYFLPRRSPAADWLHHGIVNPWSTGGSAGDHEVNTGPRACPLGACRVSSCGRLGPGLWWRPPRRAPGTDRDRSLLRFPERPRPQPLVRTGNSGVPSLTEFIRGHF